MIEANIKDISLRFLTSPQVFSPRAVDAGTLAMLDKTDFAQEDKVLDLGCGCGVVGILAAKMIGAGRVFMCDIDAEAVRISKENAALNDVPGVTVVQSDGLSALDEAGFTFILCNPPYHKDFSVPKAFIEKGFNRLVIGGKMIMVTKRLPWYKNKLTAIFGGVKVYEESGYFVFIAEKRRASYSTK